LAASVLEGYFVEKKKENGEEPSPL
jgi:hypothetical protein